jgi:hypothetical protein
MRETSSGRPAIRYLRLIDHSFQFEVEPSRGPDPLDELYAAPEFHQASSEPPIRVSLHLGEHARSRPFLQVEDQKLGFAPGVDCRLQAADWAFTRLVDSCSRFLLVHSAALVHRERGVLLVGPPFAGKTTLAVSLVARGLTYYSDDVAPLCREDGTLHPFRRAAGVRLPRGRREYRQLAFDGPHVDGRAVPPPRRLGWVFILGGRTGQPAWGQDSTWSVVLAQGSQQAEDQLRRSRDVSIERRSSFGGGLRFDLAPVPGRNLAEALRRFADAWPMDILYLGPPLRTDEGRSWSEPSVEPLLRTEAAVHLLRHTMNRGEGGQLARQYGAHPHLKAYRELFAALETARCFHLTAGSVEATAGALAAVIQSDHG